MIEKNKFLIYNEILYSLNTCQTADDLKTQFLPKLKMLIPFSYASILFFHVDKKTSAIDFDTPICYPDLFTEAENEYIKNFDKDSLLWLIHSPESTLVQESTLINEKKRINSFLYKHCYAKYDIYDTLQYSITYGGKALGILTLFRTRIDGAFSDEDIFFLRSCGAHLNLLIHHLQSQRVSGSSATDIEFLKQNYSLTNRESELLTLILSYCTIEEMAHKLKITEHTVQKHLQNLFRKMNVSSRWDILRLSCKNIPY